MTYEETLAVIAADRAVREEDKKVKARLRAKEWASNNREWYLKSQRERYKNNPKKYRDGRLKYCFGITLEKYNNMLEQQKHKCLICEVDNSTTLHVDHCHETGAVRGLLCSNCNTSLGGFKDDPALLRKAAEYLERAKS